MRRSLGSWSSLSLLSFLVLLTLAMPVHAVRVRWGDQDKFQVVEALKMPADRARLTALPEDWRRGARLAAHLREHYYVLPMPLAVEFQGYVIESNDSKRYWPIDQDTLRRLAADGFIGREPEAYVMSFEERHPVGFAAIWFGGTMLLLGLFFYVEGRRSEAFVRSMVGRIGPQFGDLVHALCEDAARIAGEDHAGSEEVARRWSGGAGGWQTPEARSANSTDAARVSRRDLKRYLFCVRDKLSAEQRNLLIHALANALMVKGVLGFEGRRHLAACLQALGSTKRQAFKLCRELERGIAARA